ncbi:MAG: hypothetical protein ACKN9W_04260 [Methylococcus sp.]
MGMPLDGHTAVIPEKMGYSMQISMEREPWGAEDASAEDDKPRIPEPMVFDLMRPLGAREGEAEVNVLGLFPLSSSSEDFASEPDALGLPGAHTEWAPEFEYAPLDGLALEVELPFQEATLAAYKGGLQWTLGKAFSHRLIHGLQLIVQYDRQPARWLPTLTHIMGFRIDRVWSILTMAGLRGNTGPSLDSRLEGILNASVFADVAPEWTLGLETNFAMAPSGQLALLFMPQMQWEVSDHVMLQGGVGARVTNGRGDPEAALRLIRSF